MERHYFANKGPSSQGYGFSMYGCESWTIKKAECWRIEALKSSVRRRLLRILWTAGISNQSILKEINPKYSLEDWCWSWSSKTLATWCKEATHWKRPWRWERLKTEGGDRGWDGWMASPIQWTWVWANSRRVNDREIWCAAVGGTAEPDTT